MYKHLLILARSLNGKQGTVPVLKEFTHSGQEDALIEN